MLTFTIVVLGSYLLGSIPFGWLVARFAGVDIRQAGSGNIGATNVTRVLGKRYGYPVFICDFVKGAAAVGLSMFYTEHSHWTTRSLELIGMIAAISAVVGHSFPIWLRFNGGKGVATSAGAVFALMPIALLIGLAIWVITFKLTRYVSLASITTAVALPLVILIAISLGQMQPTPLLYFAIFLAAVVVLRHRSNLSRLVRGTEPRFQRK